MRRVHRPARRRLRSTDTARAPCAGAAPLPRGCCVPWPRAVPAVFVCVIVSVGCEIHEQYFHDQKTAFYLYEDWTGILILTLNLILLGAAWFLTRRTYINEAVPEVRDFYKTVSAACGIYFAAVPLISIVAMFLSPWVVRKYIERAELCARVVAMVALLYSLWPSRLDRLISARLKMQGQSEMMLDESNIRDGSQHSEQELEEVDDAVHSANMTSFLPPSVR